MALDSYNIFSFMIGPTWLLDHFIDAVYFMFVHICYCKTMLFFFCLAYIELLSLLLKKYVFT